MKKITISLIFILMFFNLKSQITDSTIIKSDSSLVNVIRNYTSFSFYKINKSKDSIFCEFNNHVTKMIYKKTYLFNGKQWEFKNQNGKVLERGSFSYEFNKVQRFFYKEKKTIMVKCGTWYYW